MIQKYDSGDIIAAKKSLDAFLKRISTTPKTNSIKKNKFANNADYLEIGYIQAELDRVFHGLWEWEIKLVNVAINGVYVTGNLRIFHPIANHWITRSGIGFKEFQLSAGRKEPLPENLSSKALERDLPIANAEAMKNAAKTIGNAFGRGLNRKFNFEYIADENILNNLL